jgi:hypothetical protein
MDEDRRENRDQVEGQRGKIRWEETELKSSELTAGAVSELATMRMDGGDVAMSLPEKGSFLAGSALFTFLFVTAAPR